VSWISVLSLDWHSFTSVKAQLVLARRAELVERAHKVKRLESLALCAPQADLKR
jgi:hypothetical protein